MNEAVVRAEGLGKTYREGGLNTRVFEGLDFVVAPGETVAILGASGAGKSTLLHLLGGLDTPTAGEVYVAGQKMSALSDAARGAIDSSDLLISPACLLELQFLKEIGRISEEPGEMRSYLESEVGLRVCELPFVSVIAHARSLAWTRDPFDRMIVGQARARGDAPLVSKDRTIRGGYAGATW